MGVLKELVQDKDLTSEELASSEKVTGDSPNNAGTMSLSKGRCKLARQRALSQREGAQGCLEFVRSRAGSSQAVLCGLSKTCFDRRCPTPNNLAPEHRPRGAKNCSG
jgi:hypothetical protein